MIVVCARCRNVGVELEDEEYEHDGLGMWLTEPTPDGWFPDPDSDHGSINPGCMNIIDMRHAVREREQITRHVHGEFD